MIKFLKGIRNKFEEFLFTMLFPFKYNETYEVLCKFLVDNKEDFMFHLNGYRQDKTLHTMYLKYGNRIFELWLSRDGMADFAIINIHDVSKKHLSISSIEYKSERGRPSYKTYKELQEKIYSFREKAFVQADKRPKVDEKLYMILNRIK